MENTQIKERLIALRKVMAETGIDFYMMPTADFHNSEYVNDYFKVREFFSGFTGSNGTLVVWQEGAGLWTDGRYFIQAEIELDGTGVTLFKMGEENVPTVKGFLCKEMKQGQTLGFDGRVVNAQAGIDFEKDLASKEIKIAYGQDLALKVWNDRPALPCGETFVIEDALAGENVNGKLEQVRMKLNELDVEGMLLTKLDDLMWLFNIRGCDVECNPVALSYAYITKDSATLFIQSKALTAQVKAHLEKAGVVLREYADVVSYLEQEKLVQKVLCDFRNCNYTLYKKLADKCQVVNQKNPTELLKSIKNPVELANMEKVYLADSVAVTKFIYWLKKNIGKMEITEITAADHLESLRREIPEFLDLSFPTISAYKANGAMMHYSATPESFAVLEPDGMLLVDSGGQYKGGTTDITRTIVLGPISDEIKCHYTAVAAGMLQLSDAKWLYGCSGRNLDILARQPLWDMNIDYKCGTGHGVGYILNVHEGPQNIRWRFMEGVTEAVIEAGMDVTNEPGVYIEGSHGIRIENVMVAKNGVKNGDGQFMYFDTLTFAPIDLEAIDVKYMSEANRQRLNEYHKQVFERVSPYLNEDEKMWLREATRKV